MTDSDLVAAAKMARSKARYYAQDAVFWHNGVMYAVRPDGSICEKSRTGSYREVAKKPAPNKRSGP